MLRCSSWLTDVSSTGAEIVAAGEVGKQRLVAELLRAASDIACDRPVCPRSSGDELVVVEVVDLFAVEAVRLDFLVDDARRDLQLGAGCQSSETRVP